MPPKRRRVHVDVPPRLVGPGTPGVSDGVPVMQFQSCVYNNVVFSCGDCVEMTPEEEGPPLVGVVVVLFELRGEPRVRVRWLYRLEEIAGGRTAAHAPNEVLLSDHEDDNPVTTVIARCSMTVCTVHELKEDAGVSTKCVRIGECILYSCLCVRTRGCALACALPHAAARAGLARARPNCAFARCCRYVCAREYNPNRGTYRRLSDYEEVARATAAARSADEELEAELAAAQVAPRRRARAPAVPGPRPGPVLEAAILSAESDGELGDAGATSSGSAIDDTASVTDASSGAAGAGEPAIHTLMARNMVIELGEKHQAEIPALLPRPPPPLMAPHGGTVVWVPPPESPPGGSDAVKQSIEAVWSFFNFIRLNGRSKFKLPLAAPHPGRDNALCRAYMVDRGARVAHDVPVDIVFEDRLTPTRNLLADLRMARCVRACVWLRGCLIVGLDECVVLRMRRWRLSTRHLCADVVTSSD